MKRHVSEMLKTAKPADESRSNFAFIELKGVVPQFCCHFITQTVFASAKQNSLFLTLRRPAGYGGQEDKTSPYNTCEASASCLPQANASCSNAALHTAEPCFIRSTFTLIELLVVIAIIAILAGMLMPALGKARDRGRTVLCTGNMKVFGQANALYMDANNDWIVPSCHPPFGKNDNWAHDDVWAGLLGGYGRNSDYGLNYKKGVARGGVLKCPSEPLGYNSGQYYNTFFHYAINAGLSGLWWETGWTSYWRKQTQIDQPTKTILFGEVYAGKGGKGGSFNVKAILDLSYRHGAADSRLESSMPTSGSAVGYYSLSGGTNVTYLDGHVATRKIQDFPADNVQAAMTSANKEECGFDRRKGYRFTTN